MRGNARGLGFLGWTATFLLGFGALALARPLPANSVTKVVTSDGQPIPSIFDGLKPSWLVQPHVLRRWRPVRSIRRWTGELRPSILQGEFGARYVETQCGNCPSTEACSGHFTVIVPLPPGAGCGDPIACQSVNNFTNDPSRPETCVLGEQNSYCGSVCCVDAEICGNASGC